MHPTPINPAEAIIEPFWDPLASGLEKWRVTGGATGLSVSQFWCFALFEWASTPVSRPALGMERVFDVDVGDYDRILLSVQAPQGAVIALSATTDRGMRTCAYPPAGPVKRELELPLEGATRLLGLRIEVTAAGEGGATGWINWIGAQNGEQLARYLRQWSRFDAAWEGQLLPEETTPSFNPRAGFLASAAELEELRRGAGGGALLAGCRAGLSGVAPETLVNDVIHFRANDTRYNRAREHGMQLLGDGLRAAVAGVLSRDPALVRLAARHAMAILNTGSWEWGMISVHPGSAWETRSFVQSNVVEELLLIWDLAGDLFTPAATELLWRRVAEEGVGNTNFVAWKHEYIHHCNQLAAFSPGRILGYVALERVWPRVTPYLELAYQDLCRSLEDVVLPDGSFVEGPGYLHYTLVSAGRALTYYARSRGRPLATCVPPCVALTSAYAEAILSVDDDRDQIPICDSREMADPDSLAFLAATCPDTVWVGAYHRSRRRKGSPSPTLFALQMARSIPALGPAPRPFVHLREARLVSSTREHAGERVHLLVLGNRPGAGHTHEDKGSFVLEYAGSTFALDPGSCDYSHPLSFELKHCERHNMLVPWGTGEERPHPKSPLPADITIDTTGDGRSFRAVLDLGEGWEGIYRSWRRLIESPAPDRITITDTWVLERGEGVDFFWNTTLPVTHTPEGARIQGARGAVLLSFPLGAEVRVDDLELLPDRPGAAALQHRIACRVATVSGSLTVEARLHGST